MTRRRGFFGHYYCRVGRPRRWRDRVWWLAYDVFHGVRRRLRYFPRRGPKFGPLE